MNKKKRKKPTGRGVYEYSGYEMFVNGEFNYNIPKHFNFCLMSLNPGTHCEKEPMVIELAEKATRKYEYTHG